MKRFLLIFLIIFLNFTVLKAENAAISTDDPIATDVGKKIILEGGNAVDAAVAVAFTMAVTFPQAGNIGGGGFMIVKFKGKEPDFIDYRETASRNFDIKRFFENKKFINNRSITGYLAVGVPGTVKGLYKAWEKYGSLEWKKLLEPAIKLAKNGFIVRPYLARSILKHKDRFILFEDSKRIFLNNGKFFKAGDIIVQKDLAKTLELISKKGPSGFYEGEVADKFEKDFKDNNGFIDKKDLKNYKALLRKPVILNYKGYTIILPSLPSSGGIVIGEILNILKQFKIPKDDSLYYNLLSEAMKLSFYDRAKFMGDPDFAKIPVSEMLSEKYAKDKAKLIKIGKIIDVRMINFSPLNKNLHSTTHFSIIDKNGNAVSNTYTLNSIFGSAVVCKGTGVLLNNEIDDFGFGENVKNQFALITSKYNLAEPNKRMLSSMTPAIVLKDGEPVLITGAAGGPKIISATVQIILNVIERGMTPEDAVNAPRIHHQFYPDILFVSSNMSKKEIEALKKIGYSIRIVESIAVANTILIKDKKIFAFSDPGHLGEASVF